MTVTPGDATAPIDSNPTLLPLWLRLTLGLVALAMMAGGVWFSSGLDLLIETVALILLAGTLGLLIWQRNQKARYRSMYETEVARLEIERRHRLAIEAAGAARKLAELSLAESQRRLVTLFSNLPGMAYRCVNDLDWTMEFVSDGALELTGYRVDQLQHNREISYGQLIHPDDAGAVWQSVQGAVSDRRPFQLDYRIRTATGQSKWVWEQGVAVCDDTGRLVALEGFVADMTAQKRAEAERERLQAELTQAQKMESVGRLAGGVAHDFNNMLSVILGHAEIALEAVEPSSPLHDSIVEIQAAARRSADLTRQLLGFARRQTAVPRVLDINATVSGMLRMLRRLIGEDIDLVWKAGVGASRIHIDPVQLDQVLANLAVNARDAINGVGKLTIETGNVTLDQAYCDAHLGFQPGCYVMLAVSDDGAGIAEETLPHIFEPFFTTKGTGKGTGLGLATVYGIVKQNCGFISVDSTVGQGTTFTIFLPPASTAADATLDGPLVNLQMGQGETLLLVEDEPSVLRLGVAMLERLGYHVLAAVTPAEAMRLADSHRGTIDLLVTDVVMPAMNGRELAGRLGLARPGLRSLFVSGYTIDVIAHRGILDDGVFFLQKPYSLDTLATKTHEALKA